MKTNDELNELCDKYIVVEKIGGDGTFFITERSNFKTVNLCDCFDNYGLKPGCFTAGCYSVNNSYSDATKDCLRDLYKFFGVKYTKNDLLYSIDEILNGENKLLSDFICFQVSTFIRDWRNKNESHIKVDAWTYWDGRIYKTLILHSDIGMEDIREISIGQQRAILAELPEYPHTTGEAENIETENYIFTFNKPASYPFYCEVYAKDEQYFYNYLY